MKGVYPMSHDMALARYRGSVAVELRMQGMTYQELAEALGYTHRSAARKAVMRTIKERADMAVDAYRVQRFLELEERHRRSWVDALRGRPHAIKKCLKAADERLWLNGVA